MRIFRLIIAFILFLPGFLFIVDWMYYATKEENLYMDHGTFMNHYYNRFPDDFKALMEAGVYVELILILFFGMAGIIFLKEKGGGFKALGYISLLFAGWLFWSLL